MSQRIDQSAESAGAGPAHAVPTAAGPEAGWSAGEWWALLLICLLAAGLRLWSLDGLALAAAEARTWQLSSGSFRGELGLATAADLWTPLVPILVRACADLGLLAMHEPGSLRLPFAFLGILTVPMLALVAVPLVGRRWALLTALLLAVHPAHVAVSQTASSPVVAAFFVVGLAALLRSGQQPLLPWRRAVAALVFVLGVATDPSVWWVLAAVGAARIDRATAVIARVGGVLALLLGVLMPTLWLGSEVLVGELSDLFEAARPLWLLVAMCGCLLPSSWPARRAVQTMAWLPLGWYWVQTWFGSAAWDAVLGVALPAQCLLVVLVVQAIAVMPAALPLSSTPPWRCFRGVPWPGWLLALALFGDAMVAVGLRATVFAGNRPAVQQAAGEVLQQAGSARLRIHAGAALPLLAYYLRPDFWREQGFLREQGRLDASLELLPLGSPERGLPLPPAMPPRAAFAVLTWREWQQRQQSPPGAARLRTVRVLPSVAHGDSDSLYVCELLGPAGG